RQAPMAANDLPLTLIRSMSADNSCGGIDVQQWLFVSRVSALSAFPPPVGSVAKTVWLAGSPMTTDAVGPREPLTLSRTLLSATAQSCLVQGSSPASDCLTRNGSLSSTHQATDVSLR